MMGSAMAFPATENGHTVHLVGTPLDRDIIDECKKRSILNLTIPFPRVTSAITVLKNGKKLLKAPISLSAVFHHSVLTGS